MLVTVFSDGSFSAGRAGYSYWFKSSVRSGSGSGSDAAVSACHAELLGILAGVKAAYEEHEPGTELTFVIQCDSMQALGLLRKVCPLVAVAKTSPLGIPVVNNFRPEERRTATAVSGYITVQSWMKHVKGHTRHKDVRHGLNRTLDQRASSARKKAKHDTRRRTSNAPTPEPDPGLGTGSPGEGAAAGGDQNSDHGAAAPTAALPVESGSPQPPPQFERTVRAEA